MSILQLFIDLIQVSRPGWWLVTLWLYLAPTTPQMIFSSSINLYGLAFSCLPLNAFMYSWNDYADRKTDILNQRKGNWMFGAKGWSSDRLLRVLRCSAVMTVLPLLYWGIRQNRLPHYLSLLAGGVLINFIYNHYALSSLKVVFTYLGFAIVTVLSSWINGIEVQSTTGVIAEVVPDNNNNINNNNINNESLSAPSFLFAGCNSGYWFHLFWLVLRTQLWTDYMDYETDRKTNKSSTVSYLPTKGTAKHAVLMALVSEALWTHQQYSRDTIWATLLAFSVMGVVVFGVLEYGGIAASSLSSSSSLLSMLLDDKEKQQQQRQQQQQQRQSVGLVQLAMIQNLGGIYLLIDCWQKQIFVS